MKKAYIVCKQSSSGYGCTFECSHCGKSVFVNTLTRRKTCIRCDRKFKPIIKIQGV